MAMRNKWPTRNVHSMVAPYTPEGLTEDEQAGRDLAKLALISRTMRDTIAQAGMARGYAPDTLAQLELKADHCMSIVESALDKAGRPCSPTELADRVNENVVSIPRNALGHMDLLNVAYLRDDLEMCLVAMNYAPPREALMDGSGWPNDRRLRKLIRERGNQDETVEGIMEEMENKLESRHVHEPLVPPEEIARRKAKLQGDASISSILKGFDTALLKVDRVNKVTKGGTNLSMRALVVIGNRNGTAGYGEGKSETPAHAIERACRNAKRNLLHIDRFEDRTIYHRGSGKYVQSIVSLWPAPRGRGITASNNFSAIFELFGLRDIGAKLHGPRTLSNAVKALFNGLSNIRSAEEIARARGMSVRR